MRTGLSESEPESESESKPLSSAFSSASLTVRVVARVLRSLVRTEEQANVAIVLFLSVIVGLYVLTLGLHPQAPIPAAPGFLPGGADVQAQGSR